MKPNRHLAFALALWTAFYPIFFNMAKAHADAIVESAQQGQSIGVGLLGTATDLPTVTGDQKPYSYNHSTENNIFLRELIPGADHSQLEPFKDLYHHPNQMEDFTKQGMRNLTGNGCEQVHFELRETNRLVAAVYPFYKVKTMEADPVTGEPTPVYHEESNAQFLNQWIFIDGLTNDANDIILEFPIVPSMGKQHTKDVAMQQVTPNKTLFYRWEYQPFTEPLDGSFFAYNLRIVNDSWHSIVGPARLADGFAFRGAIFPNSANSHILFYADLYRVNRTYLDPGDPPAPCPPPYPPGNIIDGVDIVNGGVDFSDILTDRSTKLKNQGVAYDVLNTAHQRNSEDPWIPELFNLASKAAGFTDIAAFSEIFDGCTEDATIQWGDKTSHTPDIYSCTSIRQNLMDAGCTGERQTHFQLVQDDKEVLNITAEWKGRDCAQEGIDYYNECTTVTCPATADTEYAACQDACTVTADDNYTVCISAGNPVSQCDTEKADYLTACNADCDNDYSNALGACPANCATERDTLVTDCEAWNAANAGPYDMTGKVFTLDTPTIGFGSDTTTWEEDIPPSTVVFRKYVTPYIADPLLYFSYDHQLFGATGSITHYGGKLDNWAMTGTATAQGSEFTVTADIYRVDNNTIDGCNDYMMYLADGVCEYQDPAIPAMECIDDRSTCTTLDGVEFCDGTGPASGVTDLLPPWGWEKSAVRTGDPGECSMGEEGPPVEYLPPLCWKAEGKPLDCSGMFTGLGDCWTDPQGEVQCVNGDGDGITGTEYSLPGYVDDCVAQGYPSRPECQLVATNVCKDCAMGVASETCYAYSIEWDCGTDRDYVAPTDVTFTQTCGSPIRCMGTECHNPGGENNLDMTRALAALEMIDYMRSDMICQETGAPPANPNEPCTMVFFNGEQQTCKIPIGSNVGLTPNCCEEGAQAAGGIDAIAYLQLIYYTNKLGLFDAMIEGVGGIGAIPGLTEAFEAFNGIKSAVSQTLLPADSPLQGLADELDEGFFQMLINNTGAVGEFLAGILNSLAAALNQFLAQLFGQAFADSVIVAGTGTNLPTLGPYLTILMYIYIVYQILKIIGHLIFKCEEEELQLGIQRKVGNCHHVGSYCAKDTFLGCVQSNESYCCFPSPLARIIHEQVRLQGIGADPQGRRKGYGRPKHPRCEGLTISQLSTVNWNAIDLSEWEAMLQDAGLQPSSANASDLVGFGSSLKASATESLKSQVVKSALEKLAKKKAAFQQGSEQPIDAESLWGANVTRGVRSATQEATSYMSIIPPNVSLYNMVSPRTININSNRQLLKAQPVCYDPDDPARMPWYGNVTDKYVEGSVDGTTITETRNVSLSFTGTVSQDAYQGNIANMTASMDFANLTGSYTVDAPPAVSVHPPPRSCNPLFEDCDPEIIVDLNYTQSDPDIDILDACSKPGVTISASIGGTTCIAAPEFTQIPSCVNNMTAGVSANWGTYCGLFDDTISHGEITVNITAQYTETVEVVVPPGTETHLEHDVTNYPYDPRECFRPQ